MPRNERVLNIQIRPSAQRAHSRHRSVGRKGVVVSYVYGPISVVDEGELWLSLTRSLASELSCLKSGTSFPSIHGHIYVRACAICPSANVTLEFWSVFLYSVGRKGKKISLAHCVRGASSNLRQFGEPCWTECK